MSIKTYFEFIKAVIFISLLITIGFFGLQGYKWVNAKLLDIKRKNERIFNLGQTVVSLENNIRKLHTESSHTYKVGTGDPNEQYFIDIMYPVKNKDGTIKKL